jgi:hypothetical protein
VGHQKGKAAAAAAALFPLHVQQREEDQVGVTALDRFHQRALGLLHRD